MQGFNAIEVECLLIFNDADLDAIELLKTHVALMRADRAQACPKLHFRVEYLNELFGTVYPGIKRFSRKGVTGTRCSISINAETSK